MIEFSHQENIDFLFHTFHGLSAHASKKFTTPSGLALWVCSQPELTVTKNGNGIGTKEGEYPVDIRYEDITPFKYPDGHGYQFRLRRGICEKAAELTCERGDWGLHNYLATDSPKALKILNHIAGSVMAGIAEQEFSDI